MRPGPSRARSRSARMVRRSMQRRLALLALLPFFGACGAGLKHAPSVTPTTTPAAAVQPVPQPPPPPVQDPVLTLIAEADQHFKTGEKELGLGHVEAARLEFDQAVDLLLASPYGG